MTVIVPVVERPGQLRDEAVTQALKPEPQLHMQRPPAPALSPRP